MIYHMCNKHAITPSNTIRVLKCGVPKKQIYKNVSTLLSFLSFFSLIWKQGYVKFIHFSLFLLLRFTNKIYSLFMSTFTAVKLLTFSSSFVWAFSIALVCTILPLSVTPSSLLRNSIALILHTYQMGSTHSFLSRLWSQPHKVLHHTHLLDLSISHPLHQLFPAHCTNKSNINHLVKN
jgi:hypothetical protein